MREAVGSTFLFKLMIFFIFFFASFLAIAINYSQAFSIKNQIVNALEEYEGYTDGARDKIGSIIERYGYYRVHNCNSDEGIKPTAINGRNIEGVCIKGTGSGPTIAPGQHKYRIYKVSTYVGLQFPIIGNIVTIPVKGETKIIYNPPASDDDPTDD